MRHVPLHYVPVQLIGTILSKISVSLTFSQSITIINTKISTYKSLHNGAIAESTLSILYYTLYTLYSLPHIDELKNSKPLGTFSEIQSNQQR